MESLTERVVRWSKWIVQTDRIICRTNSRGGLVASQLPWGKRGATGSTPSLGAPGSVDIFTRYVSLLGSERAVSVALVLVAVVLVQITPHFLYFLWKKKSKSKKSKNTHPFPLRQLQDNWTELILTTAGRRIERSAYSRYILLPAGGSFDDAPLVGLLRRLLLWERERAQEEAAKETEGASSKLCRLWMGDRWLDCQRVIDPFLSPNSVHVGLRLLSAVLAVLTVQTVFVRLLCHWRLRISHRMLSEALLVTHQCKVCAIFRQRQLWKSVTFFNNLNLAATFFS